MWGEQKLDVKCVYTHRAGRIRRKETTGYVRETSWAKRERITVALLVGRLNAVVLLGDFILSIFAMTNGNLSRA